MAIDAKKARAVQLSFKKATQGLTPAEEAELQNLERQIAMDKMKNGSNA